MKKSLFALAAATAFTGAAQAQSSVTVYGILDVGYTGATNRVQSGTSAPTITNIGRISNSMESGSRLGFRGNEDLGGGTSAQFTFELGIQPAGNAGSNPQGTAGTTTNGQSIAQGAYNGQGSAVWNPNVRQAFVGLSQKGLGNVRIGTQNTLFWEQAGSNTTGQLSQTLGSILAPSTDGAFLTAASTTSLNGSGSASYTARTTNTVRFATDRMAGIIAKAAYTMSNETTNRSNVSTGGYTGGTSDQSGYQVALDWNIQKANIQGSYASFKSENPYSATAAQLATYSATAGYSANNPSATGWGSGTQGTNVGDTQALVTASYDFGILKAYAGWTQRKISATYNSNVFLKRTAQEIGVRGYATKTIEYWGSVGNGRFNAFGAGQPTANITAYQLGSNYWMSKRTNLYAIYGQNGTSSTTNGSFNASQYSVGVRHTF